MSSWDMNNGLFAQDTCDCMHSYECVGQIVIAASAWLLLIPVLVYEIRNESFFLDAGSYRPVKVIAQRASLVRTN